MSIPMCITFRKKFPAYFFQIAGSLFQQILLHVFQSLSKKPWPYATKYLQCLFRIFQQQNQQLAVQVHLAKVSVPLTAQQQL